MSVVLILVNMVVHVLMVSMGIHVAVLLDIQAISVRQVGFYIKLKYSWMAKIIIIVTQTTLVNHYFISDTIALIYLNELFSLFIT